MSLCKEILLPHGIDTGTDAFPVASGVTLQQGSRREIVSYLSFPLLARLPSTLPEGSRVEPQACPFPLDPGNTFHYTFSTGDAPAVIRRAISAHDYLAQTKIPVPVCVRSIARHDTGLSLLYPSLSRHSSLCAKRVSPLNSEKEV